MLNCGVSLPAVECFSPDFFRGVLVFSDAESMIPPSDETHPFSSSFGECLPVVKEQMGLDLLQVQMWSEGIYRVLHRWVLHQQVLCQGCLPGYLCSCEQKQCWV